MQHIRSLPCSTHCWWPSPQPSRRRPAWCGAASTRRCFRHRRACSTLLWTTAIHPDGRAAGVSLARARIDENGRTTADETAYADAARGWRATQLLFAARRCGRRGAAARSKPNALSEDLAEPLASIGAARRSRARPLDEDWQARNWREARALAADISGVDETTPAALRSGAQRFQEVAGDADATYLRYQGRQATVRWFVARCGARRPRAAPLRPARAASSSYKTRRRDDPRLLKGVRCRPAGVLDLLSPRRAPDGRPSKPPSGRSDARGDATDWPGPGVYLVIYEIAAGQKRGPHVRRRDFGRGDAQASDGINQRC